MVVETVSQSLKRPTGKEHKNKMEKLLVIMFDTEEKAYEGQQALKQLDTEGSIAVHGRAIVTKNPDGTVTLKEPDGSAPLGLVSGSLVGSFIGVLGGPIGWAAGAMTGGFLGAIADLEDSGVSADFIDDVSKALTPGKTAVLAEVDEDWVTPVDTRMEKLGGVIFRRTWAEFGATREEQAIAADRAEIAQLEAERAQASAERKAKIQAKIDERRAKLQEALQRAKAKSEAAAKERDAKVKALQEKAAHAKADMKAKYEARIGQLRAAYDARVKKLKALVSQAA